MQKYKINSKIEKIEKMNYICVVKKISMTTKNFKQLPYGNTSFESIMTENFAYVDKTDRKSVV